MVASDGHGHGDDGRCLADSWIPDHDDGRTQEEGVHQWQNVFREGPLRVEVGSGNSVMGTDPETPRDLFWHMLLTLISGQPARGYRSRA